MAFCAKCGVPLSYNTTFCASCGPPSALPQLPKVPTGALFSSHVAGALTYLLGFITGIIFLVIEPYNKNKLIRFHAFQSIFLHVVAIVIWIVFRTVLPFTMWYLITLIDLALFILWLVVLIQAFQGKKIVLPVIGDLAAKQA